MSHVYGPDGGGDYNPYCHVECNKCKASADSCYTTVLTAYVIEAIEVTRIGGKTPAATNRLTFNTKVKVTATALPDSLPDQCDNMIDWKLQIYTEYVTALNNSVPALTLAEANWPSSNNGWGDMTMYVTVDASGWTPDQNGELNLTGSSSFFSDSKAVKKLFDKKGEQNPATSDDEPPNWYAYWKSGNVCGIASDVHYEEDAGSYGFYNPGENHVNICAIAGDTNTGPETYYTDGGTDNITVTGQGKGPYCAAETIAHEKYHKYVYDTYNGQTDTDGDGIPNTVEGTLLGVSTLINDPDTYNMGGNYSSYGDQEIRCRKKELNTGITVDATKDWADPGTNSDPAY